MASAVKSKRRFAAHWLPEDRKPKAQKANRLSDEWRVATDGEPRRDELPLANRDRHVPGRLWPFNEVCEGPLLQSTTGWNGSNSAGHD